MLAECLSAEAEEVRTKQLRLPLGQKAEKLEKYGRSLPETLHDDLVSKRNDAAHEGTHISGEECDVAIRVGATVVELVFPLPTPPGAGRPLTRLW